jgi:superfamily II DNA or RNA helicase
MKNLFINILKTSKSWSDLKNSIPQDVSISGKLFELFTKYYFLVEPKVRDDYQHVWLYNEIPASVKEKLNIGSIEHGADLILEDIYGNYSAVQCKFRSDEATRLSWTKDKIANLFGFIPNASNYIVFTNASEIDEVSKTRAESFIFFNIHDLFDIKENTFQSMLSLLESNRILPIQKYSPKPHQKDAIDKTVEHFKKNSENSRGQLILPCGAGKTLTALWIKESLKSRNTLVLVPSLALLKQIKNDWAEQKNDPYQYVCVCSDKDIDSNKEDSLVMHTYEIDSKVISKPEKIYEFLTTGNHTAKVIFSTYQSLDKIMKAIRNHSFKFDLVICDEAHRTAGAKTGLFSLIHNNKNIPADKRLYMTATPRVTSTTLKNKIGDDVDLLYDMSNPLVYGNEIYRMSFKDAIEKGILVDYKIIAIGITDQEIQKYIEERRYVSESESIDEIANNFALEIVMNKYEASHAISFHSRVKLAEQFCQRHKDLFDYFSGHVNGSQPTSDRSRILNDFKNSEKGIVSNARCLTEGVDIPAIDLVYFCDPKNSKIDIVQAAGRALRTDHSRNKTIGYIVVPLFHNDKDNVESAIDTGAFKNVIQVIRSLADHDERLQDEINQIAYGKGKKKSSKIEVSFNDEESEVITLLNFKEKLRESLFDQIIEKTSNNWDLMYLELKTLIANNEFRYQDESGNVLPVYKWLEGQRKKFRENKLEKEQISKLLALGLNLESAVLIKTWDENYEALKTQIENNEFRYQDKSGKVLSASTWLTRQRKRYRENKLEKVRIEKLLALGIDLSDSIKTWDENYESLKTEIKNNGFRPRDENGNRIPIYRWLEAQKTRYRKNKLENEQIEKLLALDLNLENTIVFITWDENFEALKTEVRNNEFRPRDESGKVTPAYQWLTNQRRKYRENKLGKEQIDKLLSLGIYFENDPIKIWNDKYAVLKTQIENNELRSRDEIGKSSPVSTWLQHQKTKYWENKLEKEQIDKLLALGIDLERTKLDKTWDESYEDLKAQIRKNELRYKEENGKLSPVATWLQYQRKKYRENKLEKEQIDKLIALGIDLKIDPIKVWYENYETLKTQMENNKLESGKPSPAYNWLHQQKKKYRENKLEKEQIDKLIVLGIDLEIEPVKTWDENYEALKSLIEKNKFRARDESGKVIPANTWLTRQKKKYRENKLEKGQIEKLKAIGVLGREVDNDER